MGFGKLNRKQTGASVFAKILGRWRLGGRCMWRMVLGVMIIGMLGSVAGAQAVKGQVVSVGIGGIAGTGGVYREGNWVPVQVRLKNMTPVPFVGHLEVEQKDLDGDKVDAVGPEFVLQPGVDDRLLWTYFWPRADYTTTSGGIVNVVVLDKNRQPIATISTPNQMPGAVNIGPEDDANRRSTRFVVILGNDFVGWKSFDGMWGGNEAVRSVLVTNPNQLPDNVLGFDGVDTLVWEADDVKVSDISPEFQLQAMLDWVKAGGHLIISVGTQGQEFLKGGGKVMDAMPMTITGTRDLKMADLKVFNAPWSVDIAGDKPLVQVIGTLKASARPIIAQGPQVAGGPPPVFEDHPLVVTDLYGRGAITLVTMDVVNLSRANPIK
ncbi:MAG TPA: hypothetical protein VGN88_04665, partial [Phycisphaerae bacterium]